MRISIDHSGAVNDEARFTFRLIDARRVHLTVDGDVASLRREVSEAELRDLILRAQYALEDQRLNDLFRDGKLTAEAYEDAKRALDRTGPPR